MHGIVACALGPTLAGARLTVAGTKRAELAIIEDFSPIGEHRVNAKD